MSASGSLAERLARIKGTALERAFNRAPELSPPEAGAGDATPSTGTPPTAPEGAVPHDFPASIRRYEKRLAWASKHRATLREFVDDSVIGLAIELADRFGAAYDTASPAERARIDRAVWAEIRESLFGAVAEHEIGHTLGLEHNFQASADPLNYFDEYWTLRRETLTGSEGESLTFAGNRLQSMDIRRFSRGTALSDNQQRGKMRELQYSSIMDYGTSFNSDIHGLGKYDVAAVVYGYTATSKVVSRDSVTAETTLFPHRPAARSDRMFCVDGSAAATIADGVWRCPEPGFVEVFDGANALAASTRAAIRAFAERPMPLLRGLSEVIHYSQLPYLLGGGRIDGICGGRNRCAVCVSGAAGGGSPNDDFVYGGLGKRLVPCDGQAKLTATFVDGGDLDRGLRGMAQRSWRRMNDVVQDASLVRVPYAYCNDDYVGTVGTCNRWDQGADALEITDNAVSKYENYYFFRNFKRDRWAFSPDFPMGSNYAYLSTFPTIYQSWLWSFFAPGQSLATATFETEAVMNGLEELLSILGRPRYGTHAFDGEAWVSCSYATADGACARDGATGAARPTATVQMGEGRRAYSRYDYASGYRFYDKVLEVGHSSDYLLALYIIAAADAKVVGVDRASDPRQFVLSYALVFEEELTRFYDALIRGDGASLGVRLAVDANGGARVKHGSMGNDIIPPANEHPIDPGISWYQQIETLLYGLAGFSQTYSIRFTDGARVFRVGAGEQLTAGDGFSVVEFTEPSKGIRYGAIKKNEATEREKTTAVRLIEKGQKLVARWNAATGDAKNTLAGELRNHGDFLDIVRELVSLFDRPL